MRESEMRLLRAGAQSEVRPSAYRVTGETGDAVLVALPTLLRELRYARACCISITWLDTNEADVKVTEWEDR